MDNQPNVVLQNTTNVYGDGSTIHAVSQRHKRLPDDGTAKPLNKKRTRSGCYEICTGRGTCSRGRQVRIPFWWSSGQKLMAAISTDEWDIGELRLVREGGHISLSLCQGRRLHIATVRLCLLQCAVLRVLARVLATIVPFQGGRDKNGMIRCGRDAASLYT
jgi:hypothetical protein